MLSLRHEQVFLPHLVCAVCAHWKMRGLYAVIMLILMVTLGYTVMIFAFVGLTSQAETDLQDFEKMVGDWDMVRECHMLMGETDFLLKIVAYDWDDSAFPDYKAHSGSKCQPCKNCTVY